MLAVWCLAPLPWGALNERIFYAVMEWKEAWNALHAAGLALFVRLVLFHITCVCVTMLGAMKHRLRKLTALICKMSGYHSQVTRNAGLRQLQAPASPAVPGFHPQKISPWLGKTSLPFIGPELSRLPAINHSQERRLGLPWSDLIDLTYLWSKTLSEKKRERETGS